MKAKLATIAAFSVLTAFLAGPAAAQTTDDVKWINQCVADNKDEGQTQQVVLSYCTCMNNEMSNNESRSITQWEDDRNNLLSGATFRKCAIAYRSPFSTLAASSIAAPLSFFSSFTSLKNA